MMPIFLKSVPDLGGGHSRNGFAHSGLEHIKSLRIGICWIFFSLHNGHSSLRQMPYLNRSAERDDVDIMFIYFNV